MDTLEWARKRNEERYFSGWLQPPAIFSDSDDLAELLLTPMRSGQFTYPPFASSKSEARRLAAGGARKVDVPPPILASRPVPPVDAPGHRFWIRVGKSRCARVMCLEVPSLNGS